MRQLILILDFGGQYNQLIARRVRDENVYCEVRPYTLTVEQIRDLNPIGIILTGGPNSVYESGSPMHQADLFALGIPVLGICYGAQLMAHLLEGKVEAATSGEYGGTEMIRLANDSDIFCDTPETGMVWMSHSDRITSVPEGFRVTAKTDSCPISAMENADNKLYAVQFHPEVKHTVCGRQVLKNFLFKVCGCNGDWTMEDFLEEEIKRVRELVGDRSVLCAMSGGVDSSVCAAMVSKAIGRQLTCIFVDTGLMRKNEGDEVELAFKEHFDSTFVRVHAEKRFLDKLAGVTDPESKRKIIGEEFIRVFEDEAKKVGSVDFLVQGTISPDVIESGEGDAAVIKSHHNVGGLPDVVDFKELIEPLRLLFKDEVRKIGEKLELPEEIVWRQPFPGPGLAIRCIGEVTEAKLNKLRDVDAIFREEIRSAGLMRDINQYFAVLTDMRSVGVMGDHRTYDYTIALRGVTTDDFMTADWAKIPYEVLEKVSNRIINEVDGINRLVYDITSKPPATIEWE